jgi:hypothetical protein
MLITTAMDFWARCHQKIEEIRIGSEACSKYQGTVSLVKLPPQDLGIDVKLYFDFFKALANLQSRGLLWTWQ